MIDRGVLADLGKKKSREGVTGSTVNRHLAAVRAVLGWAVEQRWLDSAPSVPKREESAKRVRWATKTQAGKLVKALPAHLAAMVQFALATGLRRFNVTHLEWANTDLRRKVAWVDLAVVLPDLPR